MIEQTVETRVGRLKATVIGDQGPTALLWHSLFVDERSWDRKRCHALPVIAGWCSSRGRGTG